MDLIKYWYLFQEFWRPLNIGAYYNGSQYFYSQKSLTQPARLYLAISHSCLYFQPVRLPSNVPSSKISKALAIEVSRTLHLLEDRTEFAIIAATVIKEGTYLVIFQEKSFFEKIKKEIPRNLIICGVFPAWLALLSWFWHQNHGSLEDGLYFVRLKDGLEGFVWRDGRLENIIPFTPKAAELLLSKYRDQAFEASSTSPEEILAQGAALVPLLPEKWHITFDPFPLKSRPRIPKKALILGCIPFLFLGIGVGLKNQINAIEKKETQLKKQIKILEKKEKELQNTLKEKTVIEKIALKAQDYHKRPPLLDILTELAKLPNGTWIRKINFQSPATIQIWGESDNTLQVVKRLENSPYLKEVKVISTVTKNPRTGKENFVIKAIIEPS